MYYKIMHALFAWLVRLIYRIHVTGAERVPESGACLICANHTANADCVLLSASIRRKIWYMAKSELFRIPLVAPLLRSLGAFSVRRGENDVGAVKKSISIVQDGNILCVFPQGKRYPDVLPRSTEDKIKSGIGLIAQKSSVPVMPVYIKTKRNRVGIFRRTDIIYGELIMPEEYTGIDGRAKYFDTAKLIFDRICEIGEREEA